MCTYIYIYIHIHTSRSLHIQDRPLRLTISRYAVERSKYESRPTMMAFSRQARGGRWSVKRLCKAFRGIRVSRLVHIWHCASQHRNHRLGQRYPALFLTWFASTSTARVASVHLPCATFVNPFSMSQATPGIVCVIGSVAVVSCAPGPTACKVKHSLCDVGSFCQLDGCTFKWPVSTTWAL